MPAIRRFKLALIFGLLASLLAPATAGAFNFDVEDGAVTRDEANSSAEASKHLSPEVKRLMREGLTERQALRAYWSGDAMETAIEATEQPGLLESMEEFAAGLDAEGRSATQDDLPDGMPESAAPASSDLLADVGVGSLDAGAYSTWYSSSAVIARTNGKVFFRNAKDGRNYVCSASVINSAGKSTVWTAGHCVHGGKNGRWHQNWTFVPAYKDGARPYGTYYAKQLWAPNAWLNNSDYTADMAAVIMWRKNGVRIVNRLGGHGISWNYSKNQYMYTWGYPSQTPFNGLRLKYCRGNTSAESSFLWWSSDTLKLSCTMNGGSSGGPGLRSWSGTYGYLNWIQSRANRKPNATVNYSPYFDNTAKSLYNDTKNLQG